MADERAPSILDGLMTPTAVVQTLAERGITISERCLRKRARELGAYREIGRGMFFLPADLEAIMAPRAPKVPTAPHLRQPRRTKTAALAPAVATRKPKAAKPIPDYKPIPMLKSMRTIDPTT